ncbi:unnamed protein product [Peniophora sp. CBMAI 1063]|nr:unnamed protein product [Peniophora sp. CBMAI 1063]
MGAVDPTFPLYPIACLLSSIMLCLVQMTSLVRQRWNLGVAFLCFWLFLENIANAVNAIAWSNNADIKLEVYCDIVSHLQLITYTVKPLATFIITRRLYVIASFESVELPSGSERRWDTAIEWTLGLAVPLLVAGPLYYANQGSRFNIYEGSGCYTGTVLSIFEILALESWTILPPLFSIAIYYPKIIRTYYHQSKDVNNVLHGLNPSVSRTNYLRILALASIDILLTLPIGIVNITLDVVTTLPYGSLPFYPGWTFLHSDWTILTASYAEQQSFGTAYQVGLYFSAWTSPVLAFTIFGLFGLTSEARSTYRRIICIIGSWPGWEPARAQDGTASLRDTEFGARPRDTGRFGFDFEMGSRPPSFVNTDMMTARQDVQGEPSAGLARGSTEVPSFSLEEARHEELSGDAGVRASEMAQRTHITSTRSFEGAQISCAADGIDIENPAMGPQRDVQDAGGAFAQSSAAPV